MIHPASSARSFVSAVLASCSVALFASIGCTPAAPAAPEVVVYVSADDHVARLVIDAFENETGISVRMVGDTEAKKTTGLVQRLRAEHDNPQADVFWSSEIFQTIALANDGVLAPHTSEATKDWPAIFRGPEDRWYGFAGRARVIVYAPDRVDENEVPQTWQDLADDAFKGRVVMADPRFGTTGGHLGAMKEYWDRMLYPGYYERTFLPALADNDVRLLPSGNAGVVRAVISGEADIGATDTDDVWAALAQGYEVAMVYPRHHPEDDVPGGGTLLIPNTVGLVAGGPNPESAGRFIDFMLSAKVEQILAESDSRNTPLRPGLAMSYPSLIVPNPLHVDYHAAAAQRQRAVELAMQHLSDARAGEKTDDSDESAGNAP
jgi:iron(III) transport system substrate-binding protein